MCGIIFGHEWCYFDWPSQWLFKTIMDSTFLELIPVGLQFFILAEPFEAKKYLLHNYWRRIISLISSRQKRFVVLLRNLVLNTLSYNTLVWAIHVPEKIRIQHAHFLAFRGQDSGRWLLQQTSFHVKFLLLFGRLFINYRSTVWSLCIWNYSKIYKQCTQVVFLVLGFRLLKSICGNHPLL